MDNGSVLRRDKDETVTEATLELGSGGGGIGVGDSYVLDWGSAVTGLAHSQSLETERLNFLLQQASIIPAAPSLLAVF